MKKVSRIQKKLDHLVSYLKVIRQPSVKGLNFTITEYREGVEISFHYGKEKNVYEMRIRKSGRKLVCETCTASEFQPKDHVIAGKIFKLVGKFHDIWKEFA